MKTIENLIENARRAFLGGDSENATNILHGILQRDQSNKAAWELLYREIGGGQAFEDFQEDFKKKHLSGDYPKSQESPYNRVIFYGEKGVITKPKKTLPRPKTGPRPKIRTLASEKEPGKKSSGIYRKLLRVFTGGSPRSYAAQNKENMPSAVERQSALDEESSHRKKQVAKADLIRMILADDDARSRDNIQNLLLLEAGIDIIGIAESDRAVLQLAEAYCPDIILVNAQMVGFKKPAAFKNLQKYSPRSQVIILIPQDDPEFVRQALKLGVRDYLINPPMIDDLIQTIQRTYAGR